ncbi:MAG: ABC transporter substrate-binding protein [Methanobacteriaceae archaeon]
MDKKVILAIGFVVVVIILVAMFTLNPQETEQEGNKTITDMAARQVTIPISPDKVLSTTPTITTIIYMIAPEKLAGVNYKWYDYELKYVPKEYQNLTVVGGWFGTQEGSYEEFISISPDLIIEGTADIRNLDEINERQTRFGDIPVVVAVDHTFVSDTAESITFVGKALNSENKANKLVDFLKTYLDTVERVSSNIPENEKKKVYYASGSEGLQTYPNGSSHSQLITLCGGINVADTELNEGVDKVDVSMEQILNWNPDVIITTDEEFYKKVYSDSSDSSWANVKAVKNKEVYLSPQSPFKWFDNPPGPNIIIGIPWTAKVIYPDKFSDIDLKKATQEFYSEFYHYNLSDEEVINLLTSSGLKKENI